MVHISSLTGLERRESSQQEGLSFTVACLSRERLAQEAARLCQERMIIGQEALLHLESGPKRVFGFDDAILCETYSR